MSKIICLSPKNMKIFDRGVLDPKLSPVIQPYIFQSKRSLPLAPCNSEDVGYHRLRFVFLTLECGVGFAKGNTMTAFGSPANVLTLAAATSCCIDISLLVSSNPKISLWHLIIAFDILTLSTYSIFHLLGIPRPRPRIAR